MKTLSCWLACFSLFKYTEQAVSGSGSSLNSQLSVNEDVKTSLPPSTYQFTRQSPEFKFSNFDELTTNNPCLVHYCKKGHECIVDEQNGLPKCICVRKCNKVFRKKLICGSDGKFYASHCELNRASCESDDKITVNRYEHCLKKKSSIQKVILIDLLASTTAPFDREVEENRCLTQEYEIMKDNFLLYCNTKLIEESNNHSKNFLISIMFSHYDQNNNAFLETEELRQMDGNELSKNCQLENMLDYEDLDHDDKLSVNEFNQAFSKLYTETQVSLDKALEFNHLAARVGDNVEIKCDVSGTPTPPIVWSRNNADLATLNEEEIRVFSDGSLYLTKIQLIHAGNYTCHAQNNKDIVQTHILSVHTTSTVAVSPRIQSKRPGEHAEMFCHVSGEPIPEVVWLKNDEPIQLDLVSKYDVLGNTSMLVVKNIVYADTGAYMCEATNIGGTVRDISSLIVQEELIVTAATEDHKFFVFHEYGVAIFEPSACRLNHQIQGTDIIPGTQEYVCGDKGIKCSWGHTINVGKYYIYASQPELNRVLVLSTVQMVVVDVIATDSYPVNMYYVPPYDQVWILNWRSTNESDTKIVQVVRNAKERKKHYTVHPETIDGQYDQIENLFIPTLSESTYKYGYVTHKNQRSLYKLDLANLRYVKSIDLTLMNCVPKYMEFSKYYGFVVISCREPVTDQEKGLLVMDYLTDQVIAIKPTIAGIPRISPSSRHLVTIDYKDNGVLLNVLKVTKDGLIFSFDVKTTLNISDVTFFEGHNYDLYASASDKEDILYLNLLSGKVEMITGVGPAMPLSLAKWGNPNRPIESSGLFGQYMVTPANNALFIINGQTRTVNCEIGGVSHPTNIKWSKTQH